ncbi:MAG: hypothetical protein LV481_12480 [Methylacidiphilales bacterium]|nr:hypothetical protein [Candidatus Methylacidiphilales bacterium]
MNTTICTLFERHYHFGVAVLANSLCASGFKGMIYAGFRGPLPPWAENEVDLIESGKWEMEISPEVRLVFLLLETPAHFTNYKPDFLLRIAEIAGTENDALVYCDPDIVITETWQYFEDWLTCGVALCEDINSPLPESHPRRIGWRRFFQPRGFTLRPRGASYANGGFIGLRPQDRKLLPIWRDMLTSAGDALGGKDVVGIQGGRTLDGLYGFADCLRKTDQDTLNAALEACPEVEVSFLGPQAMGFLLGGAILPHALGPAKPWQRRYLAEALGGLPPAHVDKAFWHHASGPIKPFGPAWLALKKLSLTASAALGRFIRRT